MSSTAVTVYSLKSDISKLRQEVSNIYNIIGDLKVTIARLTQDTNGNTVDIKQMKEDFVLAWQDA